MKIQLTAILLSLPLTSLAHEGNHDKTPQPVITEKVQTGNGRFIYEADAQWGKLPNNEKLGPTHGGVAVDANGLIYVTTDGPQSMFVFKADGSLVKKMAPEARGIHHLTIVKEGEKEFLYGAQLNAYGGKTPPRIVKLDLDGKILLEISAKTAPKLQGGFGGITGVAVAPNSNIYVSMGYGSNLIHIFDKAGKHIKSFGGRGKEKEKFTTPHTLNIDTRFGQARLLISDREKRRLVHFDLNGNYIGDYATKLRRPCAVSFFGEFCAVAELESRVVILDKSGAIVSILGDNPDKKKWANFGVKPKDQKLGLFSAPHGLSFDKDGNLYVQDWNTTGRATQLKLQK